MTTQEFSNAFDTLLNSYDTQTAFGNETSRVDIVLDEYEKSVFLTQAQEEIVVNLYNGKNPYGDSFESTEEMRRYLDVLVKTKKYGIEDKVAAEHKVSSKSIFFSLPNDIAFITYEQVTFGDEALGCYNGETADVYPVTQDEYNRIMRNPFRGPTKYKVLRMDTGVQGKEDTTMVELISKFDIKEYLMKYLSKPSPIILVDLPNELEIKGISTETPCKLNDILHETILKRAVQMALASKSINSKGNDEK